MIKIKSNERYAWLEGEDGSKFVWVHGYGAGRRNALEDLADNLQGLANKAKEAALNVAAQEDQR